MRVHHVFPYVPEQLGVSLDQWWAGQQERWPLAAVAASAAAPSTVVHVISRRSCTLRGRRLVLRVHGTAYDNARHHAWGDAWSRSLGRALRSAVPDDVVVVHLEGYAAARLAFRAAHGARCVLVLHGRGVGGPADHDAVDRIVLLHDTTQTELLAAGVPPARLCKVVPSVDRDRFAPMSGRDDAPAVVGFVGRLEESKGVQDLLRVREDLRDLHLRWEVVGSAPTDAVRRQAAAVFGDGLLGEIPAAEVARRMRGWAVLLLPSYTEGLGICALEALSCGVPVVAVEDVLPATLTDRAGVVTARRSDLPDAVRSVLRSRPDVDNGWIPDHAAGGRTWDDLYASLGPRTVRHRPSLRPALGRLRRFRR